MSAVARLPMFPAFALATVAERALRELAPRDPAAAAPGAQPPLSLETEAEARRPRTVPDGAMREAARARAGADPLAQQLRTRTQRTRSDSVTLNAEVYRHAQALMARLPDRRSRQTIEDLYLTPGFSALSKDEQLRLLDHVGGTNAQVSVPARAALQALLADRSFRDASPAEQAERLRRFQAEQPGQLGSASQVQYDVDAGRRPYTISQPVDVPDHPFRTGTADAVRYDVTIDGRTIPVYLPKNPDTSSGQLPSIDDVARTLAAMPAANRALVNEVHVNDQRSPDDAEWARRFGNTDHRAYMSAGADGTLNIFPTAGAVSDSSMTTAMVHETGHFLAARIFGGDGDPRWEAWKRAMEADGMTTTRYGRNSPNEDFAEMMAFYVQVRGTPQEAELRRLYPARFAVLDEYLGA